MVRAIPFIPALPAFGALLLLVFPKPLRRIAGPLATSLVAGSFLLSLVVFGELLNRGEENRVLTVTLYEWFAAGSLRIPLSFQVDQLTAVMLLVITGVGALIHIYSIGYMSSDERKHTFFAYLNLFVASMLVLVLASNFAVMFLGWELVGLCSYLLIAFWHERPSAAGAGKKAFIVNRVGDLGFLLALFLIFQHFGTLDMRTVFEGASAPSWTGRVATLVPLFMLLGATGKSAQVPLYVWLPDAMEGPTPVSALIHAATMVTAGVYMVARSHVLFEASSLAAALVIIVGIVTAFFAAAIAMAQDDIKRVLAYSTVSQLGYMFVAVGVGAFTGSAIAYAAGIFHLVTHAFFKALLFLGAGSVMHAIGDETNMKKMGGLIKALPVTGTTFIIGWLAISGIPPLSGFFSKEAVLASAFQGGLPAVWLAGVVVAGMTAFYMSRQVFLTFFGTSRLQEGIHPHEAPDTMKLVLQGLALLAAVAGAINFSAHSGALTRFLEPVFGGAPHVSEVAATPLGAPEALVALFITMVSLSGIAAAYWFYLGPRAEARRTRVKGALGGLVGLVRNKFYVDEAYNNIFVWPGKTLARMTAFGFDVRVIDAAVNSVAGIVTGSGARMRLSQTGLVRRYVAAMFGGAVVIVALFLMRLR